MNCFDCLWVLCLGSVSVYGMNRLGTIELVHTNDSLAGAVSPIYLAFKHCQTIWSWNISWSWKKKRLQDKLQHKYDLGIQNFFQMIWKRQMRRKEGFAKRKCYRKMCQQRWYKKERKETLYEQSKALVRRLVRESRQIMDEEFDRNTHTPTPLHMGAPHVMIVRYW